jgi:hypothetical protein
MPIEIPKSDQLSETVDSSTRAEQGVVPESQVGLPHRGFKGLMIASKAWFRNRQARLASYAEPVVRRILWRVAPAYYGRRQIAREQAFHDAEDEKSFRSVALSDDEVVGVRSVWMLDVYLPGQINHLVSGLKRLSLDEHDSWRSNPVESIINSRSTGRPGSVIQLGYLVPGTRRLRRILPGRAVPADLPPGVESIFLTAACPLPGVTTLVAQFRFNEETARGIEQPLRTHYRATAVPQKRGIAFPSGDHLRDEALTEYRALLRRRCDRWMREQFPGAAAESSSEELPAAELLTFEMADPLSGRTPPGFTAERELTPVGKLQPEPTLIGRGFGEEDYVALLGQREWGDAWACAEIPGLVMRLPRTLQSGSREPHLIFSARVSDFGRGTLYADKEPTAKAVTETMFYMANTLSNYALSRLVGIYESAASRMRDQIGEVRLRNPTGAVAHMEALAEGIANLARNARPLLNAIIAAPKEDWDREVYTFLPFEARNKEDGPLFPAMAAYLVRRSQRLLETETEVRRTAESMSGLVVASVNLRVARKALFLQIVGVIIAFAAIVVAALVAPTAVEWAKSVWIDFQARLR